MKKTRIAVLVSFIVLGASMVVIASVAGEAMSSPVFPASHSSVTMNSQGSITNHTDDLSNSRRNRPSSLRGFRQAEINDAHFFKSTLFNHTSEFFQSLTTPTSLQTIACGQTISASISASGEQDLYTFSGNQGEAVNIAAIATSGDLCVRIELYDPSSTAIAVNLFGICNLNTGSVVLPATGTYTILIRDMNSTRTGNYNINLQFTTGSCAAAITCGQTVGGSIDAIVEQDAYSFSGNQGEAVNIVALAASGNLCARIELYDPAGTALAVNLFGGCNSSTGSVVLPANGTYTIIIRDVSFVGTGSYNLSVQFTTGRCATAIACGQTISASLDAIVEQDAYTFSGNQGEAVNIAAIATSGTHCPRIELFNPAGTSIAVNLFGGCNSNTGSVVLPMSGTYTIVVRDVNLNRTGNYNINLQFTTGRCATPMGCGQTITANIGATAEQDAYSFNGNQGETINIVAVASAGQLCAQIELYNPSGALIAINLYGGCNSTTDSLILPANGTYTIIIRDVSFVGTGSYNLSVQFTTGRCATAIACGQTISASLDAIVEQDAYTFSGNQGEAVNIAAIATSGTHCPRIELFNPAGTSIAVNLFGGCNSNTGSVVLPMSGTYTIVVRDVNLNRTGNYNINLQFTTGKCAAPIDCAETKSGNIAATAEQDTYTFCGAAGGSVQIAAVATSGTQCARIELYNPLGGLVAINGFGGCNSNTANLTLSSTGTYTILIRDLTLTATGAYDVTLSCSGVTCATAVTLSQFSATGYDDGVLLEWQTGYEVDNLGFNLYRETAGRRELVNRRLVAGSALVAGSGVSIQAGQAYSWWDATACESGIADCQDTRYWLEDIDLNGGSAWHGPYSLKYVGGKVPSRSDSPMLGRAGDSQTGLTLPVERATLPQLSKPEQLTWQSNLSQQAAVKLWVKREGFYRVTAAELAAAGFELKADARYLQLYADGRQIPINVVNDKEGRLSAIEFYGSGLNTVYTDQRVYWLVAGAQPGLRIAQVKSAGYPTIAQSFLYTVERRDRAIYFAALRNGEEDNFFGQVIASSFVEQSLTLQNVEQAASGEATLEVALQGVTTLAHKVWVYLNGAFAGEISFDGQAKAISKFTIAQSLLKEGDNQVRFIAQAGLTDISLVDYIRLSYWHDFMADQNALQFTAAANQEVTINGFTSGAIRLLDVTDPNAPQEISGKVEAQAEGYAVRVAAPGAGERRLLAIANELASKPAKIAANQPSRWRSGTHAADLLIIAPGNFFSAIEPLRTLRSAQGLKVELADVEDLYDEFNFGNKSPQALKDFLKVAKSSWKIKPRYLLLVGDASYDARNYLGLGDWDIVLTKLLDTQMMETASDDWLADFDGDGIAELAIGRLPARTPEEAAAMVKKIINYENANPIASMLLVADVNNGFDFERAATELRALIPASLRVEQLNRGQLDAATAKNLLRDAIARGQKVINYTGHGSMNAWNGSLLTSAEARGLTNSEKLPLFIMMTCLNGYFHDPTTDSLAESLMKAQHGGAIAVWTSTGLTTLAQQSVMNQQLYQLLFTTGKIQSNALTLGEAILKAKSAVSDVDIRRTWILLGDPTMRLK
ncbi:MAG: C25 family cysteine peptidase [Acidobacteriota bacterium]